MLSVSLWRRGVLKQALICHSAVVAKHSFLEIPLDLVSGHLFDADGTVIYSDEPLRQAWVRWARSVGITNQFALDNALEASRGRKAEEFMEFYLKQYGSRSAQQQFLSPAALADQAVAWFDSQVASAEAGIDGTIAIPGATQFVNAILDLESFGFRLGFTVGERIGLRFNSSTVAKVLAPRLRNSGFEVDRSHFVDVTTLNHGKPHPEGYVEAARQLHLSPTRCMVYEDARSGLISASASGAFVMGLRTSGESEDVLRQYSDVVADSLAHASVDGRGQLLLHDVELVEGSRLAKALDLHRQSQNVVRVTFLDLAAIRSDLRLQKQKAS